jgi:glycosyltransferase involved in cell wall biosynthesis
MRRESIATIIPVHDGKATLARALQSVLQQKREEHRIVVVDDGSRDGSAEVALGVPGVICLRLPHSGQAAAMNHGVMASSSEFLSFLDADDEWLEPKLAAQLAAFAADPSLDVVFGHAEQVIEAPARMTTQRKVLPARLPSAMLIRRSAFLRAGLFDTSFGLGMVIEWYARARDAGLREAMLDAVVYRRWIHGLNIGIKRAGERGR